jgi:hypothetical protein
MNFDKFFYYFIGFFSLILMIVCCLLIKEEFRRDELCESRGGHYVSKIRSCIPKKNFISLEEEHEK